MHFGVNKSSENITYADTDEENEMDNADPFRTSYKMRNIMESMRNYLDAHANDEMNNKIDEIKHFYCQFDAD
ncbi:hypothetical protein TNCV_102021 [Trichonephila clavipes]|nr:hypothetical protein TNCV_102021 [Trichonephila clavipes]